MQILWISNVVFPEACKELNIPTPVLGGWMYSGAIALLDCNPHIRLAVVSLYDGKELKRIDGDRIQYYLIPNKGGDQRYNSRLEPFYRVINAEFVPDLVHIHGTEYPHSLAWVKACGNKNIIASIQGLVSVYASYFLSGISKGDVIKSITIRDLLRQDSLFFKQKKMQERGKYEIELLRKIDHVIGRTTWDKSNTLAINSNITYHFCNETLRDAFYDFEWKYDNCEKQSIFLSQAHYPIKGLQQIIKALPVVLKQYPNTKVYIAGNNLGHTSWYRRNGFGNYILKLMKKQGVTDSFRYLGVLSEEKMVLQFLCANVFVCPSSIENSPNSVGEAQLLGTPCIASYVGGSMDMIQDGETGFLYRYEETNLLAMRICELFANQNLAETFSKNGQIVAAKRHDKIQNARNLTQIYKSIINENIPDL